MNEVHPLSDQAVAELEKMEQESLLETIEGEILTEELGQALVTTVKPVEKPPVGSW